MKRPEVTDEMRERLLKAMHQGGDWLTFDQIAAFAASEAALAGEAYKRELAGKQAPELAEAERRLRGRWRDAVKPMGSGDRAAIARELDRLRLSNTSLDAQLADAEAGLAEVAKLRELCGRAAAHFHGLRVRLPDASAGVVAHLEAAAKWTP